MKAIALTVAIVALAGCRAQPEPHVAEVLRLRWEARHDASVMQRNAVHPHLALARGKYSRLIQKIDASQCPKEFQVVWINYVEAWHQATVAPSLWPVAEAALGAAFGHPAIVADGARQIIGQEIAKKKDAQQCVQAWFELQKAAVIFNCPSPTNYVD